MELIFLGYLSWKEKKRLMSAWRKLPVFVYPQDNAKQMARAGSACAHRHLTQAEQLSCISFYFSACTTATTSTQKLLVQFPCREGTVALPAQGRFWQHCLPKTPGLWFHIPLTWLISSNTATLYSAGPQQLQSTNSPFLLALRPNLVLVY